MTLHVSSPNFFAYISCIKLKRETKELMRRPRVYGMAWLPKHWKLIFAVGIILLLVGGIIAIGTLTGMIENRINLEGERAYDFSSKTWYPFPPLKLNKGDEVTFYFDMRPNASLNVWGLFLYLTNSTGNSVLTKVRTSLTGPDVRIIEIPFVAPYTDTYQLRADADAAPPNSLQIYPSVSILKHEPNAMVLTFGVLLLAVGVILVSASLLQKSKKV